MSRHDSKKIEDVKVMLVKGKDGSSIASIEKTGTDGLVDTYTITMTDGNKTTFTVTNGNGIASVAKTGTSGIVDTYTITFDDGSTETFTVTNGNGIASIAKTGTQGLVDTYTITMDNGSTATFTVQNGTSVVSIEKTGQQGDTYTYTITMNDGSQYTFTVTAYGSVESNFSTTSLNPLQNKSVTNIIADVENGATASQAYNAGDFILRNDSFYKVTQAIAQGQSITVGTNIEKTTIAEELSATDSNIAITEDGATASRTLNVGEYIIKDDLLYRVTQTIAQGQTITVGVNITQTNVGDELAKKLNGAETVTANIAVSTESDIALVGKYMRENFMEKLHLGCSFSLIPLQTPTWYSGIIWSDSVVWTTGATAWGFIMHRDSGKLYKYNAVYGGADSVTPFSSTPVYQSVSPSAGSFWRYDNQGRALQVSYAGDTSGGSDAGNSYYGQCFIEIGTPSISRNGSQIIITVPETVYASNRFGQVGGGTYSRNIVITCTT